MNLIFDIGYNKGEFASKCFKKHPSCQVIGVDANLSLIYNKQQMTEQLVLIHALVASGEKEYEDFYIEPYQNGISTASLNFMENSRFTRGSKNLPPNSANWSIKTQVRTTTLDQLIEKYGAPELIKIDVEGYEYEVLKGLSQKQNKICFEWHEEEYDTLLNIIKHLQSIDYNEFGVIGYFDEGSVFEKATYSERGDPYLEEPTAYYTWKELGIEELVSPERRVNYGMMWCK